MIRLMLGDCLIRMKEIPQESIDIVITSPPYNVDLGNNKYNKCGYNSYRDNLPHSEYICWLLSVFEQVYKLLKPSGRVCINISNGKNGSITTVSDLIQGMKNIGYSVYSQILWDKGNTSNRCAFGTYLSPVCPSFPTQFEYILIFYKGSKKLLMTGDTDITKEEFIGFTNSLWRFPNVSKKIHPAPFPVELPYRLLKLLSFVGATVLDPFMGSGTTGVACVDTKRNFIGIEIDKKYFMTAKDRIRNREGAE